MIKDKLIGLPITNKVIMLLLLLVFVFATIDTHCFVYPSLSKSLIPELLIQLLTVGALFCCIVKKMNFFYSCNNRI